MGHRIGDVNKHCLVTEELARAPLDSPEITQELLVAAARRKTSPVELQVPLRDTRVAAGQVMQDVQ